MATKLEEDALYVALNFPRLQMLVCPNGPGLSGNTVRGELEVDFMVGHLALDMIDAVLEGRKGLNVETEGVYDRELP